MYVIEIKQKNIADKALWPIGIAASRNLGKLAFTA